MIGQYREVVLFSTLYILLSLPPFLFLNQESIDVVRERIAPLDIVTVAVAGTALFVLLSALFLAQEGVDRYYQFLLSPTDFLSVLVEISFVFAAVSWWLVPEVAFRLEWGLSVDLLVVAILACQLPMLLFLSLLTAIGKA